MSWANCFSTKEVTKPATIRNSYMAMMRCFAEEIGLTEQEVPPVSESGKAHRETRLESNADSDIGSENVAKVTVASESPAMLTVMEWYITRLCWNEHGWESPSGTAPQLEDESFVTANGFGFEEWLFSPTLLRSGWHFGFVQGVNKSHGNVKGKDLALLLFAIGPEKKRFLVGLLRCRVLQDTEADEAYRQFTEDGTIAQNGQ